MTSDNRAADISSAIDIKKEEIIAFGEAIYNNPETGFKEFRTAQSAAAKFRGMNLSVVQLEDIPGIKVTADTGREGPGSSYPRGTGMPLFAQVIPTAAVRQEQFMPAGTTSRSLP